MSLLITPTSFISLSLSLACLVIIWLIWQNQNIQGARQLLVFATAVFTWTVCSAFEVFIVEPVYLIWFAKLDYLAIAFLPVLWFFYIIEICGFPKLLNKRNSIYIWIIPAIMAILVLTNEIHNLVWTKVELIEGALVYSQGIAFWAMILFSYTLLGWGTWHLIGLLRKAGDADRKLLWILLAGAIFPAAANLIHLSKVITPPGLDPTNLAFFFTLLVYSWGMLHLGLLELQPIAMGVLLQNLGDAVLVFDNQDRLVYANQMALGLVGLEKINKQPAEQVFDNLPQISQYSSNSHNREVEIHLPVNQLTRSFDLRTQQLYASRNRPVGRLFVLHDSTERLEINERFHNLLEAAPDAILVVNEELKVETANERACNLFESERAEIYNHELLEVISPDDKEAEELAEVVRGTFKTMQASHSFSINRLNKNGKMVPLELSFSPYLTYERQFVILSARDVTERKIIEDQLRLQSVALTSAANGILIADKTGRIVWVNPAFTRMTGYSAEEAIGRMSNLLRSGEHDKAYYDSLWATILAGNTWQGETTNRRKDGSIYVEDQTIAPVVEPDGGINYFVAIKNDISDRKQLEQMRDNLLHTMVHDLRNPLNSIISSLDMVVTGAEGDYESNPDAHQEFISLAQISARRMENLVTAILDLNKLESGSMPINRERLFIEKLVDQLTLTQASLANPKNMRILNQVAEDLLPAWADGPLIGRVLQNLIDNAIKFGPENSDIIISAAIDENKQFITTSVQDFGSGIPITLHPRLFQKFATGGGRGTGIGLAFCRLAIEAHGGRIWVNSVPNQGTTFHFSLPIAHTGALSPNIDVLKE